MVGRVNKTGLALKATGDVGRYSLGARCLRMGVGGALLGAPYGFRVKDYRSSVSGPIPLTREVNEMRETSVTIVIPPRNVEDVRNAMLLEADGMIEAGTLRYTRAGYVLEATGPAAAFLIELLGMGAECGGETWGERKKRGADQLAMLDENGDPTPEAEPAGEAGEGMQEPEPGSVGELL
jgi:hypothetical protein